MTADVAKYLFNVIGICSTREVRVDAGGSLYGRYANEHATNELLGTLEIPLGPCKDQQYCMHSLQQLNNKTQDPLVQQIIPALH